MNEKDKSEEDKNEKGKNEKDKSEEYENEKVPFPSSPGTIVMRVPMTTKRMIFIIPPRWSPIDYN